MKIITNTSVFTEKWNRSIQASCKSTVSFAVYNVGTTASFVINNNEFILTDEPSIQIFHMPTGTTEKASIKAKMHHNLQDPAMAVYMVTGILYDSLFF